MWQLEGIDVESEQQKLVANRAIHGFYVDKLKKLYNRQYYEDAALLAQLIGFLAWRIPCGKYNCRESELVLNAIGRNLGDNGLKLNNISLNDHGAFSKRRVLHVISISYLIGGHTTALARMITNTSDKCIGSVVITSCADFVPEWLKDSVQASGGWLTSLDGDRSLLSRARTLRSITEKWADLVVLHIHPNDPIANMAYSCATDIPVILFNHADHVFWYGATVADIVAQIRPAGRVLSESRRGVGSSMYLPIPLVETPVKDIKGAKSKLGFNENDTVLFSVASAYKYNKVGPIGFLEIHEKILKKYNNVKLLVAGPTLSGEWREFHDKTGGKITAIGIQKDLSLYYACADIYVDSYPFASLTSLLDYCLQGKPAIGLYNKLSPILSSDDISLNKSHIAQAATPEIYEQELSKLIENEELRRTLGQTLKQDILECHTGGGWLKYWDKLCSINKTNNQFNPIVDEITYDDILLSIQCEACSHWQKVSNEISWAMRSFGMSIKSYMLVDWVLKRNFFCKSRISPKYFISQHTVTSLKNKLHYSRG